MESNKLFGGLKPSVFQRFPGLPGKLRPVGQILLLKHPGFPGKLRALARLQDFPVLTHLVHLRSSGALDLPGLKPDSYNVASRSAGYNNKSRAAGFNNKSRSAAFNSLQEFPACPG